MNAPFPALILALAERVQGIPLAYREDDEKIVIVFTDGRKLTFFKDGVTNDLSTQVYQSSEVLPPAGRKTLPDQVPADQTPEARVSKSKRKEKKANG